MSETASIIVSQIDHVEMCVPSRYKAAEWYLNVLGLRIIPEYEFWAEDAGGPLMISSDGGSTKLALFRGNPPGNRTTIGFHRVAFRVSGEAFLAFLDRLQDLELYDYQERRLSRELVADHGRSFSLYFLDPHGYRLKVTTYEMQIVENGLQKKS
jgi:catechol 2,3-dioxygenase-like lactoylglutathione lyase family enzyme